MKPPTFISLSCASVAVILLVSQNARPETYLFWPRSLGVLTNNEISVWTQNFKRGAGLTYNSSAYPDQFLHVISFMDATSNTRSNIPNIGLQPPGYYSSGGWANYVRGATSWQTPWFEHCDIGTYECWAYHRDTTNNLDWFTVGGHYGTESVDEYSHWVSGRWKSHGVNLLSGFNNHYTFHDAEHMVGAGLRWVHVPPCFANLVGGDVELFLKRTIQHSGQIDTVAGELPSTIQVEMPHMTLAFVGTNLVKLNLSPIQGTQAGNSYTDVGHPITLRHSWINSSEAWGHYFGQPYYFGYPGWFTTTGGFDQDQVTLNSRHIVWYGYQADELNANGTTQIRESLQNWLSAAGFTTTQPPGADAVGAIKTYAVIETTPPVPAFQGGEVQVLGQVQNFVFQVASELGQVLVTQPIYSIQE